jgi:hypothetical protein
MCGTITAFQMIATVKMEAILSSETLVNTYKTGGNEAAKHIL